MRAKWPRWLVPNCNSKPSAVRDSGGIITPALLISRSMGPDQSRANARTESRLARSRWRTSFVSAAGRASAAARPLASSRTASTTWAPARATAFAVSRPMPLFAPVTMTVRPARSGMSAVVKPLIPGGLLLLGVRLARQASVRPMSRRTLAALRFSLSR